MLGFIALIAVSVVFVLINYWIQRDSITYWSGQVMETPYSHVRYSLMVAFAAFGSFYLFAENFKWRSETFKWVMLSVGVLLSVFLHVLAVRSGLVAFYITVLVLSLRFAWVNGRWVSGLGFALSFMLLPVLAYFLVPTFKAKVDYMRYTFSEMRSGKEMIGYSDGQRLTSIQKGLEVFKQNALVGVGAGDLPKATEQVYKDGTMQVTHMPHNQWVWCLASVGLLGTLIIALSLFFPVYQLRFHLNILTVSFFVIIHTSLLTEATLEEQIGSAFYVVFVLLFVNVFTNLKTPVRQTPAKEKSKTNHPMA
jgi:O-antigen ligase